MYPTYDNIDALIEHFKQRERLYSVQVAMFYPAWKRLIESSGMQHSGSAKAS
jgi:hypothetical protein